MLGYLSILDWIYLSISYLDLSLVLLFVVLSVLVFYFTHNFGFWENIPIKIMFLFVIFGGFLLLIKTKKMGSGDFWVFFLLCLVIPFQDIVESLYISIIAGGIYALLVVLLDRRNIRKQIPFIPFMTIGFLVAIMLDIF